MTKKMNLDFIKTHKYKFLLGLLILIYSIVSFINLGNIDCPQTYDSLKVEEYQVFKIEDGKIPKKLAYFNGPKESKFNLYISSVLTEDLSSFNLESTTSLEYESVFKWGYLNINNENIVSPYIIIMCSSKTTMLGEIAFLDEEDNILKVKGVYNTNDSKLIDEQNLVQTKRDNLNSTYFDEVYFVRASYEIFNNEYIFEFSHPLMGKLIMWIPIALFGYSPFTMRFMGNIAGILMILVMFLIGKELFKKDSYALLCATIISLDGMHFTQTRIATVDSFLVLFCLLSFLFMMKYLNNSLKNKPYLALCLSGIFWGLAVSVKWNGFFFGLGLGIVFFIDYFVNKKIIIIKDNKKRFNYKPLLMGQLLFAIIPFLIYVASYIPVFGNPNEVAPYSQEDALGNKTYAEAKMDSISGFFEYQYAMYYYHANLGPDKNPNYNEHPYASKWYTWPATIKPMCFYIDYDIFESSATIATMGNPIIWWISCITFIFTLIYTIIKKDLKVGAVLVIIIVATIAPNIGIMRDTYIYHYFIAVQFMFLTIVYTLSKLIKWKEKLKYVIPVICVVFLVSFLYFYPIFSGLKVSEDYIDQTKWLSTWVY